MAQVVLQLDTAALFLRIMELAPPKPPPPLYLSLCRHQRTPCWHFRIYLDLILRDAIKHSRHR